jgi:hypothetical protein
LVRFSTRARFRRLSLFGAVAYSLAWCCLAPVLAYCTCDEAAVGYSYRGHADSCDAHDGCPDHGEPHPGRHDESSEQRSHDHDDAPVPSDQYLTVGAAAPAVAPAPLFLEGERVAPPRPWAAQESGHAATGPPGSVRAALASIVLLI